MRHRHRYAAFAAVILASGACGSAGSFGLTSEDNDPAKLAQAFRRVQPPEPGPVNELGKPMVFLVARGKPKQLVAFDLAAGTEVWRVDADVSSKIVVGRQFVAHLEGDGTLVGRAVGSGKKLWSESIGGTLVGVAADRDRVFYTVLDQSGFKRSWRLVAVGGTSGDELWTADAPGALGAPAARGGLVFSPFLKQWLAVLDAATGEQITRIRGIDEEISFVRTTPEHVYFGSKSGVFLLDERAASGKRAQSTYGSAALPEEFVRVHYHWDAFDPVQAGYSAYDRNRILWHGEKTGDSLGFVDDRVAIHSYRYFFSFDASSGELAWAYNHPRVDVVASAHLGDSIGFVSMLGGVGALDPATGRRVYEAKVDGQFLGGTFDADGWAPKGEGGEKLGTAAALASIARDRDARFADAKKFAVTALAKLEGPEVTGDLLALIQAEKTPPFLYETVVEVLVGRKDPSGLPLLLEALKVRFDYVEGTKPRGVGVVAQAIAAMDAKDIKPKHRAAAVKSLLAHLEAPETPVADLVHVIRALGVVGGDGHLVSLRSFLLVYRADPAFSTHIDAVSATIDVLIDHGGRAERELVAFVAEDPRTQAGVAEYAARALLHGTTPEPKKGESEKGTDAPAATKGAEPADAAPAGKGKEKAQR